MKRRTLLASLSAGVAGAALGQTVVAPSHAGAISFSAAGHGNRSEPVKNKPYSAEEVTEHSQTLADGTHIQAITGRAKRYRNSAGSTRADLSFINPFGGESDSEPSIIEITDAVAGVHYLLHSHTHVAQRMPWPPPAARKTEPATSHTPSTTQVKRANPDVERNSESLGTQNIDGIQAEGKRITTTMPTGSIGNDRPIVRTHESWMARDYGLIVLSKDNDPRRGETTVKLTSFSTVEPDPSLFELPDGYTVEEAPQR